MSEKPNFHKIHEQRNLLRREGEEFGLTSEQIANSKVARAHNDFKISDHGSLSAAKVELRRQREIYRNNDQVIDHEAIRAELGESDAELLETLKTKTAALERTIAARSKKLREISGNPKQTELYQALFKVVNDDLKLKSAELQDLEEEYPELMRIKDLLTYREGLFTEGHIAEVPSVKEYLARIEAAMIEGKSMFLHGPTGTGKTSLAIRSAKKLTGHNPEIIYCNPQTKESNIFGSMGIGVEKESGKQVTQFNFGPLVRAMTEGKVVILDEFTALQKDLMVMLKGILNAKPGDVRSVTGDGEVTIAPGFQIIFTANLKSEKNQERQDIPPEMANEFAQNNIEVLYQSKSEAYDIMLARLANADGTIDLSSYDLEVTLPKLAEALTEIQQAYTTKVSGDLGEGVALKKLVFNQRTIENILSRWRTEGLKEEQKDFCSFLDTQLKIPLTFKEYSENDRTLAAKILARHGLLSTLKAEDLGLAANTFSFNASTKEALTAKSSEVKHYTLREVADLDPFKIRGHKEATTIDSLLKTVKPIETVTIAESPDSIQERLKTLGSRAEVDTTIEGGLISFTITPEVQKALQSYSTAKEAYNKADGIPTFIVSDLRGMPWKQLTSNNLNVLVLNHGQTTPTERDQMVTHMDTLGYRPLTLSELMALGIMRPDLNKRVEILNTYDIHVLDGIRHAPCLYWDGSRRLLDANDVSDVCGDRSRFLFVRK
ncbi:MAG TPA: AAA family ATPase [Candidatus Paceibacterota bacterium]|nr:AAA family ATPase [Candidatus Paceibacterota bacterium]HMO82856.1 AAA family ATPase [Candidatus Paceibacterota bacterium]